MSYHRGGLPPEFAPPPIIEPLTAERFMDFLEEYVLCARDHESTKKPRADLAHAVEEIFRRLAT